MDRHIEDDESARIFVSAMADADDTWNVAVEKCAAILDDSAQEFNRLRDPGMANHDRALARKLRSLKPGTLTKAKEPRIAKAAASVAAMVDEWKNIGLNDKGREVLARLIARRLRRFWPV